MHAPSIDGGSALAATDVAARRKSQSLFCGAIAQTPRLPDPGRGRTLDRWRALAQLGAVDLGAAKLAEAHWDAQSILSELDYVPGHAEGAWAVWAADHPVAPLTLSTKTQASARLNGDKHWCSGADVVRHALVTCRGAQQEVWLAHVDMRSAGLSQDGSTWRGLGMRSVATPRLSFDDVPVVALLGGAGAYLERPGFWHGGAGIAACWWGGACAVAERLRTVLNPDNPHACAHLGAIDVGLRSIRAMLESLARSIDASPHDPHLVEVMALRSGTRRVASDVIERLARALGPGPLCTDAVHAQRCADLSVWITQQHAERDDAALGALVAKEGPPWML